MNLLRLAERRPEGPPLAPSSPTEPPDVNLVSLDLAVPLPLTPAQTAELDRRLASFEADKADVMTWEEFKAEPEERAR
jgi:putative addiction module component (TIGR02574 family)